MKIRDYPYFGCRCRLGVYQNKRTYAKLIYTAVCLMISTSISLQGNEWWGERFHPCSEYNKAKQQQVEKAESLNRE